MPRGASARPNSQRELAMWLRKIAREKRARKWKSTREWQQAQREKRKLEKRLGILKQRLEPDRRINVNGICLDVHVIRDRYRGGPRYHFEFGRKVSGDKDLDQDYGEHDLDALINAVQCAKTFASKNGSRPVF